MGADARHLRGQPRPAARAERSPGSPTICIRRSRSTSGPNPANHGSYFFGWTSTDETYWKENYRIWMAALREFERTGGLIGVGDDAGFIYQMYGFGLIREHGAAPGSRASIPIKIIQHATGNNAKILGQEERLGRVRAGLRGRPDRRQRQSAGESEGALPDRGGRDPRRQAGTRRRRRVDDQGRHSLSRTDADGAREGNRRAGAEEVRARPSKPTQHRSSKS